MAIRGGEGTHASALRSSSPAFPGGNQTRGPQAPSLPVGEGSGERARNAPNKCKTKAQRSGFGFGRRTRRKRQRRPNREPLKLYGESDVTGDTVSFSRGKEPGSQRMQGGFLRPAYFNLSRCRKSAAGFTLWPAFSPLPPEERGMPPSLPGSLAVPP